MLTTDKHVNVCVPLLPFCFISFSLSLFSFSHFPPTLPLSHTHVVIHIHMYTHHACTSEFYTRPSPHTHISSSSYRLQKAPTSRFVAPRPSAPSALRSRSRDARPRSRSPRNCRSTPRRFSRPCLTCWRGHGPKSLAGFVSMETSQPINSRRDDGEDGIMPVHETTGTPDYEVSTFLTHRHTCVCECGQSVSLSLALLSFIHLLFSLSLHFPLCHVHTHCTICTYTCMRVCACGECISFPHHLSPPGRRLRKAPCWPR